MPILPASPSINYGVPVDFERHLSAFVVSEFPGIIFIKCISFLIVDVGSLGGLILLGFVGVYAFDGGQLIGPLPYYGSDGNDGDASGGVL